jgi:hypothetical protein
VIEAATAAGTLSRVRAMRLLDILVGPAAAERLYYSTRKK